MAKAEFLNASKITVIDATREGDPCWEVPDVTGDPDWAMDCAGKKIVVTIASYLVDESEVPEGER